VHARDSHAAVPVYDEPCSVQYWPVLFFLKAIQWKSCGALSQQGGDNNRAIFLLHVAGVLWSDNTNEAWKDIRIKMPLLVLTVILCGTGTISKIQFRLVLGFFIASVVTGICIVPQSDRIATPGVIDIRDVFIFHISHIRFALFTCIAIFSLLWFALYDPEIKSKPCGICL
jgi:hypothetical protein